MSASQRKAPLWVWMLIVVALTIFAIFLASLANKKESTADSMMSKDAGAGKLPQVRFDFYRILKEHELKVSTESTSSTDSKVSNVEFWLQVASFKNWGDADRLRAQLLLLNFSGAIETVDLKKKRDIWHRVFIGPFKSRSNLEKARKTLVSNDLNSMVKKRKVLP